MIFALAVLVRNIKSVMELSANFVQIVQDAVLDPSSNSAIALFVSSFLNELVAIFPFAVVLAGQLFFLKDPFSIALIAKLLVFVAIPVGIGSSLGVLPVYVITYFGGKPAINKLQKYLRFSWQDVEKVNLRFRGQWYDEILFLLLRTIPVMPSLPLSIAAGVMRMKFLRYFFLSVLGLVIRMILTLLVVGIGMEGLSQL